MAVVILAGEDILSGGFVARAQGFGVIPDEKLRREGPDTFAGRPSYPVLFLGHGGCKPSRAVLHCRGVAQPG